MHLHFTALSRRAKYKSIQVIKLSHRDTPLMFSPPFFQGVFAEMADSMGLQFVSAYAFEAMQKVDVVRLAALSDPELRLLLPCLVRMALCAPADQSQTWAQDKKLILRLLSGVEAVNSIVALLSVDFHALEQDARKEQQLRYTI